MTDLEERIVESIKNKTTVKFGGFDWLAYAYKDVATAEVALKHLSDAGAVTMPVDLSGSEEVFDCARVVLRRTPDASVAGSGDNLDALGMVLYGLWLKSGGESNE